MPPKKRPATTEAASGAAPAQPRPTDSARGPIDLEAAGITDNYLLVDAAKACIRDGKSDRLRQLLAVSEAPGPVAAGDMSELLGLCANRFYSQVKPTQGPMLATCARILLDSMPCDAIAGLGDVGAKYNPWAHLAIDHPGFVTLLLEYSVPLPTPANAVARRYATPPYRFASDKSLLRVLATYIERGGPGARDALTDGSLLCHAAECMAADAVRVLRSAGADPTVAFDGRTPLQCVGKGPKKAKEATVAALTESV